VAASIVTQTPDRTLDPRGGVSGLAGAPAAAAPKVGRGWPGAPGLVPYAITRGGGVGEVREGVGNDLWRPAFPSADLVQHAADLVPSIREASGRDSVLTEGPRWEVKVSPGTLRVRTRDYAKAERTHEREIRRRQHYAEMDGAWDGDAPETLPTRGTIVAWSRRSRLRMIERLAELDYSRLYGRFLRCSACGEDYDDACERCPVCRSGDAVTEDRSVRLPSMLTYTYPGDWQTVAGSAEVVKAHFDAWCHRYQEAWGEPFRGVWKREFQVRGAPHLHVGTSPPMGRVTIRVSGRTLRALAEDARVAVKFSLVPQGDRVVVDFARWFSITWSEVVNHPDDREFRNHLLAGTGVDYAQGIKLTDPRRLAVYFTKYGQGGGKEVQNQVPPEWVDAAAVCLGEGCGEVYDADLHECPACGDLEAEINYRGSVGRFWGVRGLRPAVAIRHVTPAVGVAVGRIARRWYRSKGLTRTVSRPRVGQVSGRTRYRKSRSRKLLFKNGRGFLCVNDGPAFVSQIGHYLSRLTSDANASDDDVVQDRVHNMRKVYGRRANDPSPPVGQWGES
jgi:hypothetical protein